jgi:RNA polymerase-binding transcription factor DksA
MSRIEADARELLLRRRHSLSRKPAHVGDPAAHWGDWETVPEPVPERVRRELADIDAALTRIQEGCYGTCVNCGGPMGLQRLRAIPEARYCMACSGHVDAAE